MSQLNASKKAWFDKPSAAISSRMKKVKSRGTKLEKQMEALFKKQKLKYERQPALFGRPDFRIKKTKILVFCDSSFWHGRRHKELKGEAFKKNKDFWINKLLHNKKRDVKVSARLKKEKWSVLRFWDTDISKHPDKVIKRLERRINENG